MKNANLFLNGYDSAVRGAYESGATEFVIGEKLFRRYVAPEYDNLKIRLVSDEKIALAYSYGLALSGKRTVCFLSSIPFDLASTYGYAGVNGALVIIFVEDNEFIEFDSRPFFAECNYPIFEPSSPAELKRFVKISFNFSEKYDVPSVIRVCPHLLDSFESVDVAEPKVIADKPYKKDSSKYVLLPSTVRLCSEDVVERNARLKVDCESFPVNVRVDGDNKTGVIASGEIAKNVKEAMPEVCLFALGLSNPLPIGQIKKFAESVDKLYVVEEHPFIENVLRKNGIDCRGEDLFLRSGRRTVFEIASQILKKNVPPTDTKYGVRTPDYCTDCGLVSVVISLKKKNKPVFTDNGCGLLSGCFLSANEVGIKFSLPTAIAFAQNKECICLLTEKEFIREIQALIELPFSIPPVVVVTDGNDYKKYLPLVDRYVEIDEEEFEKIETLQNAVYFVNVDKVCKYES